MPNDIKLTAGGSSSAPSPPWIELPRDITANILRRLGSKEILENAEKVCTTWRSVCREPSMWRVIDIKKPHGTIIVASDLMCLCRRAVDRSQGELIDFNIDCYVDGDLLHYISERSSRLKRLRLGDCDHIHPKNIARSVIKFPELEELHLFFLMDFTAENIEAIGISCPKLKSFTFNNRYYRSERMNIDDSCAMAIAKNMPNLRHLFLIGNRLSNEGLKAILNGCPNLESLDLRQCFCVDLQGDFGKMCSERIKFLKCHSNANDYEWGRMIYELEDYYSDSYESFDSYSD